MFDVINSRKIMFPSIAPAVTPPTNGIFKNNSNMIISKDVLTKSLISGVIAGVGSSILFGDSLYGPGALIGGSVAVGSIISDQLSEKVYDKLPGQSESVRNIEKTLTPILLTSGGSILPTKLIYPQIDKIGMAKVGIIGPLSKMGGDWIYSKLF